MMSMNPQVSERTKTRRIRTMVRLVAALLGLGMLAGAGAFATNIQTGQNVKKITIVEKDYSFTPNHLDLTAGETVRITLVNKSTDKTHEFLMGKDVKYSTDNFGKKYANGWKTPLLGKDAQVIWGEGKRIEELQIDEPSQAALEDKGGTVTFQFKVPDKPGNWMFGCFEEKGSHFTDHNMKGTITIHKASGSSSSGS